MELKKICSGGMVLMALLAFLPLAQAKDFAVQRMSGVTPACWK